MNTLFEKVISLKAAIWTVIISSVLISIVHLFILFQIIPFKYVWAGKIKTVGEMYIYEGIALFISFLLIFILLVEGKIIHSTISKKAIHILLWLFVIFFILNTAGNLASKTSVETMIATPLTGMLALFSLRIVLNR